MNTGPNRRGGRAQKYHLTDAIREALLRDYDSCNRRRFAERFGVPAYTITKWATELGVARTKERPWTAAELELLETHLPTKSWAWLSRALGRTKVAIRLKAKRLRLLKCKTEGYTANGLAALLGVDVHKVTRWIARDWLKARPRGTDRTAIQGGDVHYISNGALRRFVCAHPDEIDLRRVDKFWFIDLLAGTDHAGYGPAARVYAAGSDHPSEEAAT